MFIYEQVKSAIRTCINSVIISCFKIFSLFLEGKCGYSKPMAFPETGYHSTNAFSVEDFSSLVEECARIQKYMKFNRTNKKN